MRYISRLAAMGSGSIGNSADLCGIPEGLQELLAGKNGYYAFESALLIRHVGDPAIPRNIDSWNSPTTWKSLFEVPPAGICFAENLFGEQFVLNEGAVWHFDPETSEITPLSDTLDEWAKLLLDDYDYRTGYSLARGWQHRYGPLRHGMRLIPRRPFVIGGEYILENLKAVEEGQGMRIRAAIANQIRNLPDGSRIEIRLVD